MADEKQQEAPKANASIAIVAILLVALISFVGYNLSYNKENGISSNIKNVLMPEYLVSGDSGFSIADREKIELARKNLDKERKEADEAKDRLKSAGDSKEIGADIDALETELIKEENDKKNAEKELKETRESIEKHAKPSSAKSSKSKLMKYWLVIP